MLTDNIIISTTIIENLAEGVYTIDKKGFLTYVNPAAAAMLGWEAEDLIGLQGHKTIHYKHADGSDYAWQDCSLVKVLQSAITLHDHEDALVRKDGSIFPILSTSSPIILNQEIIGSVVSFHDITERKQAEARRAAILDSSIDAILTLNHKSEIMEWNLASERIFGYSKQAAMGRLMPELIIPERLRAAHYHGLSLFMSTGEAPILGKLLELPAQRSDGSEFLAELTVTRIPVEGPPMFTGTVRDITERKQTQEALKESELKFRTMAESIPQLAWMADKTGDIFWFNQRWYDYTGISPQDMNNTDWFTLLRPSYREEVKQKWRDNIADNQPFEMIFSLRRADDEYRTFLTMVAPTKNENDEIICWFGSNTDITQQKLVEQALRESEENVRKLNEGLEQRVIERTIRLQKAHAEMEAFTYSVSHDLRAPLRGLQGFSFALLEEYADQLDDKGKEYLRFISDNSEKMGELIDGLLTLSRLNRMKLEIGMVDLSELTAQLKDSFNRLEPSKSREVFIEPNVMVKGDRRLLRQVIQNLFENAWKFTSHQSKPIIQFGTIQIENKTVYYMKDNGAGFDMTYKNKLFEPFNRLHKTDEYPGNGIGLATVARIINSHGGKIWAEGGVGEGATFYFTLNPTIKEDADE